MITEENDYGLIECECCHDLHDVLQMRITEDGYCYCDKCTSEAIIINL